MNRLQAFLLKGKNLVKQRLMHPQNESLEQVAQQAPTTASNSFAQSVAQKGGNSAAGTVMKVTPLFSLQVATQTALNTVRRHNQMKLLVFQLRRPFRSGHFINAQRRAFSSISRTSSSLSVADYSEDDLDAFWHLQNQFSQNRNQQERYEREDSEQSSDLSSSGISSAYNYVDEDANAGAYEGIMSVLDDPKKDGERHYCSSKLETRGDFIHQAEMRQVYPDLECRSEKVSIYQESCCAEAICAAHDPIQELANSKTKGLIAELSERAHHGYLSSVASEDLAMSIDGSEYNSESYELLKSHDEDLSQSAGPKGILVPAAEANLF